MGDERRTLPRRSTRRPCGAPKTSKAPCSWSPPANCRWADWIAARMAKPRAQVLVAIGVGHLAGNGVDAPDLLRAAKGLKVERVE